MNIYLFDLGHRPWPTSCVIQILTQSSDIFGRTAPQAHNATTHLSGCMGLLNFQKSAISFPAQYSLVSPFS